MQNSQIRSRGLIESKDVGNMSKQTMLRKNNMGSVVSDSDKFEKLINIDFSFDKCYGRE